MKKSWHQYFFFSYIDYKLCGQSCLGLGWNRHKVPSLTKFIYQFYHSAHKNAIQSGLFMQITHLCLWTIYILIQSDILKEDHMEKCELSGY